MAFDLDAFQDYFVQCTELGAPAIQRIKALAEQMLPAHNLADLDQRAAFIDAVADAISRANGRFPTTTTQAVGPDGKRGTLILRDGSRGPTGREVYSGQARQAMWWGLGRRSHVETPLEEMQRILDER